MKKNKQKPNLRLSIPTAPSATVNGGGRRSPNDQPPTPENHLEFHGITLDQDKKEQLKETFQPKSNSNAQIPVLSHEDFDDICELGSGGSGCVKKVLHRPSGKVMARKMIHMEVKPSVRTLILRELQTLHVCNSPYIVTYYGSFYHNREISVCMEHMNCGSLDKVITNYGYIPENVVSKITKYVLEGLNYLKSHLNMLHRDIKPSNILINSEGDVKVCDFGVSGQLIDSMANSFVGTRSYMAPERLLGSKYDQRSDIWSLGLSIVEMCLGVYPIPSLKPDEMDEILHFNRSYGNKRREKTTEFELYNLLRQPKSLAIFELLEYIVEEDSPRLPEQHFSSELCEIVKSCLLKNPQERPDIKKLLNHTYIVNSLNTTPTVEGWINSLEWVPPIDSVG